MIDRYFNRPVIIDYLLAFLISGGVYFLYFKYSLSIPKFESLLSLTTDLSTVALTFAGFILTLLTVLITFKMAAKVPENSDYEGIPLFDLFFSTRLYTMTISLLKGCIKSLGLIAVTGFSLKLFLNETQAIILFMFNAVGLVIIGLTFARSLLILTKITKLQDDSDANRTIENGKS